MALLEVDAIAENDGAVECEARLRADQATNSRIACSYGREDIGRLAGVLQPFGRLIVTPPVLAEVSNLGDRIDGFLAFLTVVLPTAPFEERCVTMPDVLAASGFSRLGFTDSTVERLGAEGHLVITDDFPLDQTFLVAKSM